MHKLLLIMLLIVMTATFASAAILVYSPSGAYTTKATLEAARTAADAANKTIVVTSPLTSAQSNITGAWPADRGLKVEVGGSINPTTAFTGLLYVSPAWFGATGDGSNETAKVQKALDAVVNYGTLTLDKLYTVSGLYRENLNRVTITGSGGLKKPASVNGQLLKLRGCTYCTVSNIIFDGSASGQTANSYTNSSLYFENGDHNIINNVTIATSYGDGITLAGTSDSSIRSCKVYNTSANGIYLAGSGTSRNIIDGNIIDTTIYQNGIFVTGMPGYVGGTISAWAYDNIITNNILTNIGDTSIEHSFGATRGTIAHNKVEVKSAPGILLRESQFNTVTSNTIRIMATAIADGISTFPWDQYLPSKSIISSNQIIGDVGTDQLARKRAAIGVYASDIVINGNKMRRTEGVSVQTAYTVPTNLVGEGILVESGLTDISLLNNDISGYRIGIDLNFGASSPTHTRLVIRGNTLFELVYGVDLWAATLDSSDISGNNLLKISDSALRLTNSNGNYSSKIGQNNFSTKGFSGVTGAGLDSAPVKYNVDQVVTEVVDVPYTQTSYVGLYTFSKLTTEYIKVEFGANNEYWILAKKVNGALVNVARSTTVSTLTADNPAWLLTTVGDTLILQRYGVTISNPGLKAVFSASR